MTPKVCILDNSDFGGVFSHQSDHNNSKFLQDPLQYVFHRPGIERNGEVRFQLRLQQYHSRYSGERQKVPKNYEKFINRNTENTLSLHLVD